MTPFESEQWMTRFEKNVEYNLADSSVPALQCKDLEDSFQDLFLDYGNIDGSAALVEGIEALYENHADQGVIPTLGSSQANLLAMEALLRSKDEIIVFEPEYRQFERLAERLGCSVKKVKLDESGQFDPDELERAIGPATRMICLSMPNNPMGTIPDRDHLQALVSIAERHGLWILSDEVYRLDSPSLSDLYKKAVSTGSLSKVYGAAGLRFGWARGNPEWIEAIRYEKDYHSISTGPLIEALALRVLEKAPALKERARTLLRENRKIVQDWLFGLDQKGILPGQGSCLLIRLPHQKDEELCTWLARQGVLLVPGSYFGRPGTARLGLGIEPEKLEKGLDRLKNLLFEGSEDPFSGTL